MDKQYWARTQASVSSLAGRYGDHYLEFLDVPELGPEDYLDVDHLNPRGAVFFTRMLRSALEGGSSEESRVR